MKFGGLMFLGLFLFLSGAALAKNQKWDLHDDNVDFVAVRGLPWGMEYFIDRKAKICLLNRNGGGNAVTITAVPCQNLVEGYPELKSVISWVK